MPELPEVECVRQTLSQQIPVGAELEAVKIYRKNLRFPIPRRKMNGLVGAQLLSIRRRGKYILFRFSRGILISHLGMTGQWQVAKVDTEKKKHEHLRLRFKGALFLSYSDPRRFGYVEVIESTSELGDHVFFKHLGVEPLSRAFTAKYLKIKSGSSKRSVKVFLMDQKIVVGIGNIYASEILFLSGVNPIRETKTLTPLIWEKIASVTKRVLQNAIGHGGSSIRDYRSSDGQQGSYQQVHQVYGKTGMPCPICSTPIISRVIGNRTTFWCPRCQR
jgi:formamidopyrimidine-DNA glycosylase